MFRQLFQRFSTLLATLQAMSDMADRGVRSITSVTKRNSTSSLQHVYTHCISDVTYYYAHIGSTPRFDMNMSRDEIVIITTAAISVVDRLCAQEFRPFLAQC
jgi:hypothetical protein